jgi:sugar/nucleoside kinase (ribokinase family)
LKNRVLKIGVIGTFILDHIYNLDGEKTESLGGLTYTLAVLANLLSDKDEIYPIAQVGSDGYDKIITFLSNYKNVRLDGLKWNEQNNTHVTLRYHSKESRTEILSNLLPPIEINQVMSLGQFDVILINFITGFELTLAACNAICSQKNTLIGMDYHSLTLGIDEHGKRFFKKPENWEQWLTGIDILQMNEYEAQLLSDKQNLSNFGLNLNQKGIRIVNITLGAKGSLIFVDNKMEQISAFPVPEAKDVTGCGDAFMSGFIKEYLNSNNPINAAHYANRIAGLKCTIVGTEQINTLSTFY